jgi:G3E family GTPase
MLQIPVTVLTGYLGAGKTTLLNRILKEHHGKRYAVIFNEFGDIGIDNDLVVAGDEEIFEMNNGCICCTVRGDLIRILDGLMKRRGQFSSILIETTGLADPAPVAQTFFVDDDVRSKTRLDAIVAVADARNLPARLADSHEAEEQLAFADVILLNKVDLVSSDELAEVEQRIRMINAYAVLHKTTRCDLPLDEVLDRGAFDLDRILSVEPNFLGEDAHEHDDSITSVSMSSSRPLQPDAFIPWVRDTLAEKGTDILRSKGIIAFPEEPRRFVFQGVHMLFDGDLQQPWGPGEARQTRVVFIGRNLDEAGLRQGFQACVA